MRGGDNEILPEGWANTILNQVGLWSTGGTPSRKKKEYFGGKIPWVKSGDLTDGKVVTTEEFISQDGLENSAAKLLPVDSLLIALYGATIGKLGVLEIEAATNQACAGCQVNTAISETWYVFYFLMSQRQALIDAGQGGAQPNLTNGIIREWPIPLPPLAEQRRIVAKVEELLARVRIARERLARVPLILKRFRQAILTAACNGQLTADWRKKVTDIQSTRELVQQIFRDRCERFNKLLRQYTVKGKKSPKEPSNLTQQSLDTSPLPDIPDEWEWVTWNDLADWITYGFTRPMPHVSEGIPIVTAKNVRDGYIDFNEVVFTTPEAFVELSEKDKPRRGEILITKDGAIRGRAAIVETNEPICISQAVAIVRFGGVSANSAYLLRVIQSKYTQDRIEEESSGMAIPHLSITNFGRFPVPLPPMSEQYEIVQCVDALFKLADAIERRVAAASARADNLTQAILAKAFRGELVPTEAELARAEGRDYETAEQLLARIGTVAPAKPRSPRKKKQKQT